jgi:signal transduction histidine kinase
VTVRRLQAYAVVGALLLVALLEAVRHAVFPHLQVWHARVLLDGIVILGALVFFSVLFRFVRQLQDELLRQNRELLALHAAAEDVHRASNLDDLLQRVVDEARDLVGARYGALSVMDAQGVIAAFLTSGLAEEERRRIGDPPRGKGLLGVVLYKGQVLRLSDLARDPRSAGFPPNHPPMRSLLAVPVDCRGPFRGNLYLADKLGAREFAERDVETLLRLATQAAIAIDNQFLHRRLRELAVAEERARIARDLHDGTAQVLAYVNTKALAVREYLRAGKSEEAGAQLDQLAAAAREVASDVREGILGLRATAEEERSLADTLRAVVTSWSQETGVDVQLASEQGLRLEPERELQLLRIVQEALANVRKHSRAGKVRVALRQASDTVEMEIEDDGEGFDPEALPQAERPRFGLATMAERARAIGGHLRVESRPGGPTRLRVDVPLRPPVFTRGGRNP